MIVPTYLRAKELKSCLAGLAKQSLRPREIVVVRREHDAAAADVIRGVRGSPIIEVVVSEPGVVAAMVAGVHASASSIIAFTDDDAVPRRDWIARIVDQFHDPTIGAVGGRDVIAGEDAGAAAGSLKVGRVGTWGRMIGNHHLATGSPRDVDVLKGVNMAFRRTALALPSGLRGTGAQVYFEVATCWWARYRGWRLVYDPAIVVDHAPAWRVGGDPREAPTSRAIADAAYNAVVCLGVSGGWLLIRRVLYALAVGDRTCPGLTRAVLALLRGESGVAGRVGPSATGAMAALRDASRGRSLHMEASWTEGVKC